MKLLISKFHYISQFDIKNVIVSTEIIQLKAQSVILKPFKEMYSDKLNFQSICFFFITFISVSVIF